MPFYPGRHRQRARPKLPNVELLVMDGVSTDNTVEILKSYGDRIRWISEPDKGQTDAINKGTALLKGEILAYLNSDDILRLVPSKRLCVISTSIQNVI